MTEAMLDFMDETPRAALEVVPAPPDEVETAALSEEEPTAPIEDGAEEPTESAGPDDEDGGDDGKTKAEVDPLDTETPATDIVRAYLTEIGRTPLLSAEKEVSIAKRIEAGLFAGKVLLNRQLPGAERQIELTKMWQRQLRKSTAAELEKDLSYLEADGARARNHLLEANLRLGVSLAKRYQGRGLPLLDLIDEGNIGLIRAVEKFDYTKGYKFSTYATWWVRQALQRGLADQGRTIRVPVHMVEQINKVLRVKRQYLAEHDREATTAELGQILDLTPEKVEEVLGYGRETVSLDTPVGDDGTSTFGELIEDVDAPIAADIVDFGLLQDRLRDVLGTLPERSALVVRARFGLDDGRPRTLDEVGRKLGLTRERIRQIERDTLKMLRKSDEAAALKAWL